VEEAADGSAGLIAAAELWPDLVLMDVLLPGEHGTAVADRLAWRVERRRSCRPPVAARRVWARASGPPRSSASWPKDELSGAALWRLAAAASG
jgi:hypothetical protein